MRASDTVARLAGDEFVVVAEGLVNGAADAELVAGKIVAAMTEPFVLSGQEVVMSTSIGVAVDAHGELAPTDLLARADAAMYRAKQSGRNRYRLVEVEPLGAAGP